MVGLLKVNLQPLEILVGKLLQLILMQQEQTPIQMEGTQLLILQILHNWLFSPTLVMQVSQLF